ncbi:hypothetical protein KP509_32G003900 [Ceratopteris richardii]|uniref:TIR domain-containing protein n=1 Tax=Ceratopteris richardii TaxID=49495 RepID=A0A8T2QRZ8_CERRI|nr:hypothetical protein KP509_32G003900 [Ceratopteris richardii]
MIFISYHGDGASDVEALTRALDAEGLTCVNDSSVADTILIYITSAYIAPGSPTMDEADEFLGRKEKFVIPIFGGLSVRDVKLQLSAAGWDERSILRRLTDIMGIDMKNWGFSFETVATKVKASRATSMLSPQSFDVFLSHAGEDKDLVNVLHAKLEERKYTCFLDMESIKPGGLGVEQLLVAAGTCRLALFVLSDRSIKKPWPVRELGIFRKQGISIFVVWYRLLREQVRRYVDNPPSDLLQNAGAHEFLNDVVKRPDIRSIEYPERGWNNPDIEIYSQSIVEQLSEMLPPI